MGVSGTKPLRIDLPDEGVERLRVAPEKASVKDGLGVRQAFDPAKLRVKADRWRPKSLD